MKKLSGWNYRVVKEKEKTGKGFFFSIRDVYYDEKGNPKSWGAEPQWPIGESRPILQADFELMAFAYKKPVLLVKGSKLVEL